MDTSKDTVKHRTKVARLIDEYDLEGFGDELERLWTASGDERRSLRELAEILNKRVLKTSIERSDINTLSNDIDGIYLRLQGEKGTPADQTRTRRQLEREGVNVETVQSDFVTYQAVRSFLQEERNAEYEPESEPVKRDKANIQQLRNRTKLVTETKLDGLENADQIELGSHQITVDINVYCEDCNRQFDVIDILDQGRCNCNQ